MKKAVSLTQATQKLGNAIAEFKQTLINELRLLSLVEWMAQKLSNHK